MEYLARLIGLPFFAMLTAIAFFREWLRFQYLFLKNGGEAIPYKKPRKTIEDVYQLVADIFEEGEQEDDLTKAVREAGFK